MFAQLNRGAVQAWDRTRGPVVRVGRSGVGARYRAGVIARAAANGRPPIATGAGRFFFTIEDRRSNIWIVDITEP